MEKLKTIELRTAYVFDCDDCGRENFVRAVIHEFSADEMRELAMDHGITPGTGDFVTIPEQVRCSHCGSMFTATDMRAE